MSKKNNKKSNKKSKPVAIEDLSLEGWDDLDCCGDTMAQDNLATIDTLEVRLDLIQTLADLGAGLELYCNGCCTDCAKAGNLFEVISRLAKG